MEFNEIDNLTEDEILEIYNDYLEMENSDMIATDSTWYHSTWKCSKSVCSTQKCAVYGNHEPDGYTWYFYSTDCIK